MVSIQDSNLLLTCVAATTSVPVPYNTRKRKQEERERELPPAKRPEIQTSTDLL